MLQENLWDVDWILVMTSQYNNRMNQLLSNFEYTQRERERTKQHYIRELRSQMMEQLNRKKREEQERKQADQLFEQKVEREREEMRRKFVIKRRNLNRSTIIQPSSQSSIDPQRNPQQNFPVSKSALYSPVKGFSSPSTSKNISTNEYTQSRPRLPFHININYLKAKQNLQQQKQKIVRFRTQISYPSKRRFKRTAATALDNLKNLTIQMQSQSRGSPFVQGSLLRRKNKQLPFPALPLGREVEIRSVNEFKY